MNETLFPLGFLTPQPMVDIDDHQLQSELGSQPGHEVQERNGIHPATDPHNDGVPMGDHPIPKQRRPDPLQQLPGRHVNEPSLTGTPVSYILSYS